MLDDLRREIDELDTELTKLMLRRMRISAEIAREKSESGLSVFDAKREDIVLKTRGGYAQNPSQVWFIKEFFRGVMRLSRVGQTDFLRKRERFKRENTQGRGIALIGMPGCGKSSIGKRLAHISGRAFCDVDKLIEKNAGMSVNEIFAKFGEARFRVMETEALRAAAKLGEAVIATGGGVVTREENMEILSDRVIIYLNRPIEIIAKSVKTARRPLLAGGKDRFYELFAQREPLYRRYADITFVNRGRLDEVARRLMERIDFFEGFGD